MALPLEQRVKVRDSGRAPRPHRRIFEENPYKFDPDELCIVKSWKDLVAGDFCVLRSLKKCTVFLTVEVPDRRLRCAGAQ